MQKGKRLVAVSGCGSASKRFPLGLFFSEFRCGRRLIERDRNRRKAAAELLFSGCSPARRTRPRDVESSRRNYLNT